MYYKDAVTKIMDKANILIKIASMINSLGSEAEKVKNSKNKTMIYEFEKTSETSYRIKVIKNGD